MVTKFWKKARGDHIMVSAVVTAMAISYLVGINMFGKNGIGICFFFFSSLIGTLIPLFNIPKEWIDNSLPRYHFWRDLLT